MFQNILSSEIWKMEYFSNTVSEYALFVLLFVILSFAFFILKFFLLRKVEYKLSKRKELRFVLDIIDKVSPAFYIFISFYFSLLVLKIPEILTQLIYFVLVLWAGYYVIIIFGYRIIDFLSQYYLESKTKKGGEESMVRMISRIAKAFLWLVVALTAMSLLGLNISTLVAGMGVGGIAIAFAIQRILSDLFSSFSIYFDKPFIEGDFIRVGDKWGTVEKIGIKSTRIRALQGEEIIFSNKELTSEQVHNLGNMKYWRADIKFGIVYATDSKKMEKIPDIIKKIVEKEELVDFDRVHFENFGDFSLNYLAVVYIQSSDFHFFMDTKQKIMLNIKKEFEKKGIEFAYPTSTVHLFSKK